MTGPEIPVNNAPLMRFGLPQEAIREIQGVMALYLAVEKFKICRLFKNGEMQGSEKIQGAQCIAHT